MKSLFSYIFIPSLVSFTSANDIVRTGMPDFSVFNSSRLTAAPNAHVETMHNDIHAAVISIILFFIVGFLLL